MVAGCRRSTQKGTTLLGLTVAMSVAAILMAICPFCMDSKSIELVAAHDEIVGSLDQAFTLARARGSNVKVALGRSSGIGEHLQVQVGPHIKWGKPAHIPVPADMDADTLAAQTGESHPVITVTPRRTTLASAWFLNNGEEALCMRLNGHGHFYVLRWRPNTKKWVRL